MKTVGTIVATDAIKWAGDLMSLPGVRECTVSGSVRLHENMRLRIGLQQAGCRVELCPVDTPQVTHTDRNPIPVSLPERVGDRLVFEPVERSEKAAEVFQWVGLAWNLGVFNPLVGLLTPDYSFSGWGFCW